EDLMDISRITSGKTTLRRDAVRLSEIVDAAVEAVRPRIAEAGHTLSVNLPTEPPRLYADETRLVQVLTNPLTNATRYTPAGGQIWLVIQIEDGGLVISVKDTGVGIPREKLEQIFEMFTQVDDASQAGQG